MNEIGILGLFCGAASLSGLMLSARFYRNKNQKSLSHLFLALLFLSITMRIGKSIWYFILYDVAQWGLIGGFLALSVMGPSLLLYIKQSQNDDLVKWDAMHLFWPLAGLIIKFAVPLSYGLIYIPMTGIIGLYLAFAIYKHVTYTYASADLKKFNAIILLSVTVIWGAFVYQHTSETMLGYAYGAAVGSMVIFALSISQPTKASIFNDINKSKIILPDTLLEDIRSAFEEDKVYLQNGITLTQFSKERHIPAYLVTKSVNQIYNKTFPETVNFFRVQQVKRCLEKERNKAFKIEALAYEAGFSTPSSFYVAFKKETGMTPTSYQRQFMKSNTPKVA